MNPINFQKIIPGITLDRKLSMFDKIVIFLVLRLNIYKKNLEKKYSCVRKRRICEID